MFSHVLAYSYKKYYSLIFLISFLLFATPAQIDGSEFSFSPSIFSYIFNVTFEGNFSTKVLRPLALSLPIGLILFAFVSTIKRKFFRRKD